MIFVFTLMGAGLLIRSYALERSSRIRRVLMSLGIVVVFTVVWYLLSFELYWVPGRDGGGVRRR